VATEDNVVSPPGAGEPRSGGLVFALLAGLALAALAGVLIWRRRATATRLHEGAEPALERQDPEPAMAKIADALPRVADAAPEPAVAQPALTGLVSTRFAPRLEIALTPLRCTVGAEDVTIEFEVEVFNSGKAAARAVGADAILTSGAGDQGAEIGRFFERYVPAGSGRIDMIEPLTRVSVRHQVVARRDQLQLLSAAGRTVLVPIVAVDVRYSSSGGPRQSGISALVGRETGADRLAPIPMEPVPRVYRNLAARPLPQQVADAG